MLIIAFLPMIFFFIADVIRNKIVKNTSLVLFCVLCAFIISLKSNTTDVPHHYRALSKVGVFIMSIFYSITLMHIGKSIKKSLCKKHKKS